MWQQHISKPPLGAYTWGRALRSSTHPLTGLRVCESTNRLITATSSITPCYATVYVCVHARQDSLLQAHTHTLWGPNTIPSLKCLATRVQLFNMHSVWQTRGAALHPKCNSGSSNARHHLVKISISLLTADTFLFFWAARNSRHRQRWIVKEGRENDPCSVISVSTVTPLFVKVFVSKFSQTCRSQRLGGAWEDAAKSVPCIEGLALYSATCRFWLLLRDLTRRCGYCNTISLLTRPYYTDLKQYYDTFFPLINMKRIYCEWWSIPK